jgi:hypothetical protein
MIHDRDLGAGQSLPMESDLPAAHTLRLEWEQGRAACHYSGKYVALLVGQSNPSNPMFDY